MTTPLTPSDLRALVHEMERWGFVLVDLNWNTFKTGTAGTCWTAEVRRADDPDLLILTGGEWCHVPL